MIQKKTDDAIEIVGASENNLKHIDLTIPKEKLVVFVGVSGSGKSSLAFDTIAVESSRQWQASYPLYLRNKMPQYERPAVEYIHNLTPSIVVDQKPMGTNARSTVGTATDVAPLIRLLFSRVGYPSAGGATAYSFNHPLGMCPTCTGLGICLELDEDSLFDQEKTIRQGGIRFSQFSGGWQSRLYLDNPFLNQDKILKDLSDEEWEILRYGTNEPLKIELTSNNTGKSDKVDYEGVIHRFRRLYLNRDISKLKKSLQDEIMSFVQKSPCTICKGTGLNPNALASKINNYNIADYYDMQVSELLPILRNINTPVGTSIAKQIADNLNNMVKVGLGYLTLSRRTDTLSGGEIQRLKMIRHLGSNLSNITYIFDEPTAGLHPDDAKRIAALLLKLRDKHNLVLVVEHSRSMIEIADEVIELGPQAGNHGGHLVFQGTVESLKKADTQTAQALREPVILNRSPRTWKDVFLIENATINNLKEISVSIPKGVLTVVSGVAGSGKSSLIREFVTRYPESIVINQKTIGTSSRSTPATYTGAMDEIRKLFAKENGVGPEWFSSNSKGACPVCNGKGEIKPDVAFADAVAITCEECGGGRFNSKALSYKYAGKNIKEVLALTINQALDFFSEKKIINRLQSLHDVGLGYMTLGQSTSTFSGGENQRLKLASELYKKGNTYVLDEPSTGLHNQDIKHLVDLFNQLVNQGNTVLIVEHRLEMIALADWVIDLGPIGGKEGGRVVFSGTPADLIGCEESVTAHYLKSVTE
ncbi:excinuclease ABC subunit UvrA [Bacillus subtilis]|uniref:ATP-binding cassette domain-containing protein n=1 Tax=Bacillus subtilis TaxID=1423 RepID=UPI00102E6B39|nr:excinuclease ABC subunit UvrA [Bacillus subtilis]TAH79414.1 excinuclease ABC subunit UvrA [Bacillus subtilis]TAH86504.1 excinuclease ABC subunit UvrA [Bacillus subtilis]